MIAFDLKCGNGHVFEGWFEDGAAFEKQLEEGMISCPVCSDISIEKTLSAFSIKSGSARAKKDARIGMERIARHLSDFVKENFDDVGCDFAGEALKMHYGAAEPRSIRGTSTAEEEENLKKEGVPFLKTPVFHSRDSDTE
ncbi:conserved hypothetical protein [Candidatus Desulfarcum epimagneticum]|uniref:DUF1178 domain-containing protein n=1 Tax=uncultured Desulfobacteraceae bacterium TaxID=218296 RepID=A0A484HDU5_9BACT|nr:conserved hypothetical protein [uncultured Desulfobacteraceae bacterium]